MAAPTIRQAHSGDALHWLELLRLSLGDEYPDKQVYDPNWIVGQLDSSAGETETWVSEIDGSLSSAISILPPRPENLNQVANLGRHCVRPEAYADGSAELLLRKTAEACNARGQIVIARVLASDNPMQILYEKAGFVCVGFQPFKHLNRVREGALFYARVGRTEGVTRLPLSDALPQVNELASSVLPNLHFPIPASVRDGAVGYPLQTEVQFHDGTADDFELWRMQAEAAHPPIEVSGVFNQGVGYLRVSSQQPFKALIAQRESKVVAGVAYHFDPVDRGVRILNTFCTDDISIGALLFQLSKISQEQLNAIYLEVDILMTAPRLLKSAEQLGFVPIAYLPAFYVRETEAVDVIKLIKLNMVYSPEPAPFTAHARAMAEIIDHNFQDQKMGVAIINLLRSLPIFDGLGDGELRKIARLFTQKLFRANERIFSKGDSGKEAYVVMRGQIDILLEENTKPIASIGNGQIFGELAFLDGAARVALALATQPSILLVIQRSAFNTLVQQEPHLGMVVMRNIAMELSNRLRKTNAAVVAKK